MVFMGRNFTEMAQEPTEPENGTVHHHSRQLWESMPSVQPAEVVTVQVHENQREGIESHIKLKRWISHLITETEHTRSDSQDNGKQS